MIRNVGGHDITNAPVSAPVDIEVQNLLLFATFAQIMLLEASFADVGRATLPT
ncbi:hypothetical protein [Streptomyces ortus]|uniref:Uncharacterized protein n=1 Tax=Streptomyces ortus TaxID=2867268 RepID=A0ABT3VGF5_9ACTN|nr:hypothetical protein [Streptomyces ortus]MCX4238970.1 hypothetical protein [Streptomyces ortus]